MKKIHNWYMVAKRRVLGKEKYDVFVTTKICNNYDLQLPMVKSVDEDKLLLDIVIIGDVYDGPEMIGRVVEGVERMKHHESIVITNGGNEYVLGKKQIDYEMFVLALEHNVPIMYNYYLIEINGCRYIYGDLYADNVGSFCLAEITSQNMFEHTLTLKNGQKIFVVWSCINPFFEILIKQDKTFLKLECKQRYRMPRITFLNKEVIDVFNSELDYYPNGEFLTRSARCRIFGVR